MVSGNSEPSSKKPTPHKPNFYQRASYIGILLFWASTILVFLVNLASVTAQEFGGGLFGLEFPIVTGLAVVVSHSLIQHVIYSLDPVVQFGEIMMGHYAKTIGSMHQRIVLWIFCLLAVLAGSIVGAALVLAIDGSFRAGMPIVPPGMLWQAFGVELLGGGFITWVYFAAYFNPESWANRRKTNVPILLGVITAAVTWVSIPYSSGCFNPLRYIASSIVNWHWQEHGWVFVGGYAIGALLFGLIYFWNFRTTKEGTGKWNID
jgi:hypothetical protein